jgi:hypothetical protein
MRHIGRSVADIVRRLDKAGLAPAITLEIHRGHNSDAEMVADLALALVPAAEEVMTSLRAVTRLIIYGESSDISISAPEELGRPELLARWIALFPALLHVSLRVRGDDDWATVANARTISEQNPNVRSLELNGTLFGQDELKLSREWARPISTPLTYPF